MKASTDTKALPTYSAEERKLGDAGLATLRRSCLTKAELCAVLQIGDATLAEYIRRGCPRINVSLKPVTSDYARLRFDLDAVLRWIHSYSYPHIPVRQPAERIRRNMPA